MDVHEHEAARLCVHSSPQWVSVHTPLHSVGYLLDPEYWNMDLMSNEDVVQDFYKVVNVFYAK